MKSEREKLLEEILNSLNVGIIHVDENSNISFINRQAEAIRNISEERLNTSVLDCHSQKMHSKVNAIIDQFRDGKFLDRHKMVKVKGKYFDNSYNRVLDKSERFKGIVMLSQDVTEKVDLENKLKKANEELERKVSERTREIERAYEQLKMAQEQLMQSEKMAAIGQFVAGLAHEINNPLDGIQNCIRTVLNEPEDRNQTEQFLNLSLEGLFKIELMVKQLLDFGRPKSFESEKVDANEILERIISLTQLKVRNRKINLVKNFEENLPKITGDNHHLEQVFVNLILNALDAIEDEGKLSLSTYYKENKVFIEIEDSGCGIPEENKHKVFEPFFTTKQKNNGTGLGLYLSYNVITRLGGKIHLESKEGEGTKFVIVLPAETEQSIKEEDKEMVFR